MSLRAVNVLWLLVSMLLAATPAALRAEQASKIIPSLGHAEAVTDVAITPDGTWVATAGGSDGTVKLWNRTSGRLIRTFQVPSREGDLVVDGFRPAVQHVAISKDGNVIAGSHYSRLFIWNAITGDVLHEVPHFWKRRGFGALRFTPDGTALVAGGATTRRYSSAPLLVVLRVTDAKQLLRIESDDHHSADTVLFSPAGDVIYTTGQSPIAVWDAKTGKIKRPISVKRPGTSDIDASTFDTAISADGRVIAGALRYYTTRTKYTTALAVWQTSDGKVLQRIDAPAGEQVLKVALNSDGSRLAVARGDRSIAVFNRGDDKPIGEIKFQEPVQRLQYIEDGRRLLVASGRLVSEIDAASGKVIQTLGQGFGAPGHVSVSPNGRWLVAATVHNDQNDNDEGKTVYKGDLHATVWDLSEWRLVRKEHLSGVALTAVAIDDKGRVVTTDKPGSDEDTLLTEVHVKGAAGGLIAKLPRTLKPVALAPGGGALVASTEEGHEIWSVADARRTLAINSPPAVAAFLTFDRRTKTLYSGGYGGVTGWDPEFGTTAWKWDPTPAGEKATKTDKYEQAVLLPSGLLAVPFAIDPANKNGPYAGSVRIVDPKTGRVAQHFLHHTAQVRTLAYAPKANRLVTVDLAGNAFIWSPDSGTPEKLVKAIGPNVEVREVAISPDARFVALHRTYSPSLLEVYAADGKFQKRFSEGVAAMAFSADGRQFVALTQKGVVEQWSTTDWHREAALALPGFKEDFGNKGLALSPGDGRAAVSAGDTIYAIDLAGGRVLATLALKGAAAPISFGDDDNTLFVASNPGIVRIDIAGKRVTAAFAYTVLQASLSADGRMLLAHRFGGTLIVRDLADRARIKRTLLDKDGISSIAISRDGGFVATAREQTIRIWSVASGDVVAEITEPSGAGSLAFSPDGERLFLVRAEGSIGVWKWRDKRELATLYSGDPDTWLVMTPAGFFSGAENARRLISVVTGADTISAEQVFEHLGRGDLVIEQMKGDPESKYDRAQRELDLKKILKSGAAPAIELLGDERLGSAVRVKVRIKDEGGGIGRRLVWRLNGQVRGETPIDRQAQPGDVVVAEQVMKVDPSQQYVAEAIAYNAEGLLASEPRRFFIGAFGASESEPPRMHVLAVGVTEYVNPDWKLKLAAADARAFGKLFEVSGKGVLYYDVKVTYLIDEQVTAGALAKAFEKIAKDPQIKPKDVFVLYLAGHGRYDGSRYYYIPQDLDVRKGHQVRTHGISQDMLQKWIASVEVDKRIVVIDTCESAEGAGGLIRALASPRLTAMEQLQHATGDNLLAAAGQAAFESNKLGHGLLTYSVIEAMARRAGAREEEQVTFDMVASHAATRVPELSREIFAQEQCPIRKSSAGVPIPLGYRRFEMKPIESIVTVKERGYIVMRDEMVHTKPADGAMVDPPITLTAPTSVDILEFDPANAWVRVRWGDGAGIGWIKADAVRKLKSGPN